MESKLQKNDIIQKLDTHSLKILENQLNYELMMHKKFYIYSYECTDMEFKILCQKASEIHKKHYHQLLEYLNAHL